MQPPLRPFLKYPGRKDKIAASHISRYYEPYRDRPFVDLFCGSGAVSLTLRPEKAILVDANPCLMNLHSWIQIGWGYGDYTQPPTCKFEAPQIRSEEEYLSLRSRFNAIRNEESLEAATCYYALLRTCYNGLVRHNLKGEFNTPWGKYKKPRFEESFQQYHLAYQDWLIVCDDYRNGFFPDNAFVYADPPYHGNGNAFTGYNGQTFGLEQQVELAKYLAAHDGPALTSNAATPETIALYTDLGFEIEYLDAKRSISCTGDRTPAKEILAFKHG